MPPRTIETPTIGSALRRSWFVIALLAIVLAGVGAVVGSKRPTTWTSQSQLSVGQNTLSVQGIAGFAEGGQAVAESLSRSIGRPEIIRRAAREADLPLAYVASHVAATPVANTAVFTITATGDDEVQAVAIATATAASVTRYANTTLAGSDSRSSILQRYRSLSEDRAEAVRTLRRLNRNDASTAAIAEAQAEVDQLELQTTALRDRYNAQSLAADNGALVSVLTPATEASSDRTSNIQLWAAYGAVVGLLVGVGIALLAGVRRARRVLVG